MDQDIGAIHQNQDIIKEVQEINQISKDPNYETFSKTSYWHQQNVSIEDMNQGALLKETTEILMGIENKLARIESLLETLLGK